MRYILLISVLFLASCTAGNNTTKPTTTKPTATETRTIATPSYGSGKMQVEVFADFQCPACIASNESLMPIFEEYAASGKLTITYRQFPLTSIHKNAKGDAIAALCSAEGGKFMEYKKVLYALEKSKASKAVTDTERVALAKGIGLDEAKFASCLSTRAFEKQVESDMALGESRGVNGTPTIFLDGIKLDMSLFRDLNGFRTFLEGRMK
ncbi:DsbA family protein [Candidatus Gracilibacteria bacterium]|nr:DsbA family protein [Candidatus Gracilibacteria bacterium]